MNERKIKCWEKDCKFTCRILQQLRQHLQEEHQVNMENDHKTFNTEEG